MRLNKIMAFKVKYQYMWSKDDPKYYEIIMAAEHIGRVLDLCKHHAYEDILVSIARINIKEVK